MNNRCEVPNVDSPLIKLQEAFGPSLTIEEVAEFFSVKEEDVLSYHKNFGGVMITPDHCVFYLNLILQKVGLMPTLDKRQKSGPRWKGVAQSMGQRMEKRFADDREESYQLALMWEDWKKKQMQDQMEAITMMLPNITTPFFADKKPTIITLGKLTELYLQHKKATLGVKTFKEKESCFRDLKKFFGEDKDISKIEPLEVSNFYQSIADARSGNVANKIRKNINAAWKWASTMIPNFPTGKNPFHIVGKLPEIRRPRYMPPLEDFEKVLKVAKDQDWVMLKTFYFTAGRRGEIYKLKWSDILFEKDRIRLWTNKRRNGNRECDLIPLHPELKVILRTWKDIQPMKSEYVFVNDLPQSKGYGKPYVDRVRVMTSLCEDAGVKRFTFHSIRHLAATTLRNRKVSHAAIQRMLRHKNPKTTSLYLQDMGLDDVLDEIGGVL